MENVYYGFHVFFVITCHDNYIYGINLINILSENYN